MTQEDIKNIRNAADTLGLISRAISTLQNCDILYIASDYSVNTRYDADGVFVIPKKLREEFRKKLIEHYKERYNEITNGLKTIDP